MKPKPYGIVYLLIDATCDKEYVGQTTRSFKARFNQHKKDNQYIDRIIKKRGEDLIATAILKICYSRDELDYWEKRLIKSRNTMAPNGYNLTEGGGGISGLKFPPRSPEHCAKLSAAKKGKHPTAEARANMSVANSGEKNGFFGKQHTAETKSIIAAKNRSNSPFKNLLKELGKHQLSYTSLAEILNLKQQNISNKMLGKYNFLAQEVDKLVEFFGLSAEYLMARDDEKEFSTSKRHETSFKNLLNEMDKRQLSYTALAKLLDLSFAAVSFKMSGKRNFTPEQVAKLEEIFGLPAEYLLKRD